MTVVMLGGYKTANNPGIIIISRGAYNTAGRKRDYGFFKSGLLYIGPYSHIRDNVLSE